MSVLSLFLSAFRSANLTSESLDVRQSSEPLIPGSELCAALRVVLPADAFPAPLLQLVLEYAANQLLFAVDTSCRVVHAYGLWQSASAVPLLTLSLLPSEEEEGSEEGYSGEAAAKPEEAAALLEPGVISFAVLPRLHAVACLDRDRTSLLVMDVSRGKCVNEWPLPDQWLDAGVLRWSEALQVLALARQRNIYLFTPTALEAQCLEGHTGWISELAVVGGGFGLASVATDCSVRFWSLVTHKCVAVAGSEFNCRIRSLMALRGSELVLGCTSFTELAVWRVPPALFAADAQNGTELEASQALQVSFIALLPVGVALTDCCELWSQSSSTTVLVALVHGAHSLVLWDPLRPKPSAGGTARAPPAPPTEELDSLFACLQPLCDASGAPWGMQPRWVQRIDARHLLVCSVESRELFVIELRPFPASSVSSSVSASSVGSSATDAYTPLIGCVLRPLAAGYNHAHVSISSI